jgi:hypothetical protein
MTKDYLSLLAMMAEDSDRKLSTLVLDHDEQSYEEAQTVQMI